LYWLRAVSYQSRRSLTSKLFAHQAFVSGGALHFLSGAIRRSWRLSGGFWRRW
jgi:hypothetical protein